MGITCGWSSVEASFASLVKRSRKDASSESWGAMTFNATERPSSSSRARYRVLMPPRPTTRSTAKPPTLVPIARSSATREPSRAHLAGEPRRGCLVGPEHRNDVDGDQGLGRAEVAAGGADRVLVPALGFEALLWRVRHHTPVGRDRPARRLADLHRGAEHQDRVGVRHQPGNV